MVLGVEGCYGGVGLARMQCYLVKGNPKQEPGGISSEDKVQMEWESQ